jgi:hypothetical protein
MVSGNQLLRSMSVNVMFLILSDSRRRPKTILQTTTTTTYSKLLLQLLTPNYYYKLLLIVIVSGINYFEVCRWIQEVADSDSKDWYQKHNTKTTTTNYMISTDNNYNIIRNQLIWTTWYQCMSSNNYYQLHDFNYLSSDDSYDLCLGNQLFRTTPTNTGTRDPS